MAPEVVTDTAETRKPALMIFSALEPAAMVSGVVVKSPISCPDARRQITVPKSMITQLDSRVILGIYYKLQTFLYLPANGIIQGMRPLIGYNFGAREMKRVKTIFRLTLESSCVIMLFGTVICLPWHRKW